MIRHRSVVAEALKLHHFRRGSARHGDECILVLRFFGWVSMSVRTFGIHLERGGLAGIVLKHASQSRVRCRYFTRRLTDSALAECSSDPLYLFRVLFTTPLGRRSDS
jgi:hypothetical protein